MDATIRAKLLHSLTQYDIAQSKKAHHNRYAMAHYCKGLQNVTRYVAMGFPLRDAILTCFCGSLANRLLRVAGMEESTDAERRYGPANTLPELDDESAE